MPRTKTSPARTVKTPPHVEATSNGAAEYHDVLTLAETAAYLRVPAKEVLRMVVSEKLPGRKFGAEWRFFKRALQNWLGGYQGKKGLLSQLGTNRDDPYLDEMLENIYAQRGRPQTETE